MAGDLGGALEGLRHGDPQAFREVYAALSPTVLGYLRSRGSRDPEGLTQEVFLTVFRQSRELTGGDRGLRTFIFSVAHARLVDELRSRARRPQDVDHDSIADLRTSEGADEAVDRQMSTQRTLNLLQQLPPSQREVVSMRIVAGLTLEETAEVIGRSVGAVKQLQRRGLLTLRDILSGSVEDEDVTS